MIKKKTTNQRTSVTPIKRYVISNSELQNEGQLINNLYERKSKQSVNLSTAY